ncbi:hypothetical protein [Roseivivax sediminis]|uniref:MASE1 protein n=1 Tax=Roseivivax sediminis TaxID=936889 RepID=A0A1I1VZ82_9RHOB|nr:hypothetical protein [Roseivivax sediminis]SFD88204.1 hypothetical protein SAMN04515678_10430 [Roseivivax sediminis]
MQGLKGGLKPVRVLAGTALVACLYVIAHATTALVITPLQYALFQDTTDFASLLYLPHGVRVLAVWLLRWQALPGLFAGAFASELIFTDGSLLEIMQPVLLESIAVGALSGYLVFEALRLSGEDAYAGANPHLNWQQLFMIGIVSSIVNSIGQSIVFGGLVVPENAVQVLLFYAIGDILGLFVMLLLTLAIFRGFRAAE